MAIDTDDEALAKAVARGNERAFGLLVARHIGRVRAIANGYLGSAADADEVAQDVFVTVWRNAGQWRAEKGRFSTWLHRVTVNRCIDRHRARRRPAVPIEDVAHGLAAADDPERALAGRQALGEVRQAIGALPDRQRLALLLSVSAGLANAEIAQTMGISRGAVEQLLVRARSTLRTGQSEDSHDRDNDDGHR